MILLTKKKKTDKKALNNLEKENKIENERLGSSIDIVKSRLNGKLPLSSDIVFKRTFSREENKDLLKSVLEAILNIDIKNITIKNPILNQDLSDSKAGTLDIKVELNNNMLVDVEMQVANKTNFINRNVFYLIGTAQESITKGEAYSLFKKTVTISIVCENLLERNSYMNKAYMRFMDNREDEKVDVGYINEQDIVTDKLEMIFIELPKFIRKNPKGQSLLNQWLWLIAGMEEKINMEEKNEDIKKAEKIINEMSMDPLEWEIYDSRRKAIMNYNTDMITSREEGKKEKQIEIAKNLLKLKIPIEDIITATGLTIEEIENLK